MRMTSQANPLTAAQIAARTNLAIDVVRRHIAKICIRDLAHNVTGNKVHAAYAWGGNPATSTRPTVEKRGDGTYDGRELRAYCGRPGAMDAFTLPSLQNGKAVPRKAPILMAAAGGLRMTGRGAVAIPAQLTSKERR